MAMIKCKECGKEISDKAISCPECGYVYKKQNTSIFKIALISFLTILISGCLLFGGIYLFTEYIPKAKIDKEVKTFYGKYELVESDLTALKGSDYEIFLKGLELKQEIELTKENVKMDGDLIHAIGYGNFSSGFGFSKNDEYGVFLVVSLDQLFDTDNTSKLDFDKDGDYLYLIKGFRIYNYEKEDYDDVKVTIKYKQK